MSRQYKRKINVKLGANPSIDISQKMESYRQRNELYRVLVDQAGVGIFVTDWEYRLINVNSWFCSMFGYAKEELREKNFVELIVSESLNNGYELVSNLKEGKKIIEELWCWRNDNSSIIFLCELTIKIVAGGRLQGIARDVTKYRQTELALKESVARYQAVVEDQIE